MNNPLCVKFLLNRRTLSPVQGTKTHLSPLLHQNFLYFAKQEGAVHRLR